MTSIIVSIIQLGGGDDVSHMIIVSYDDKVLFIQITLRLVGDGTISDPALISNFFTKQITRFSSC